MKKTLMASSICLFLFSCVEINKSENEIVGKWIISVNDYDTSWGEYLVINGIGIKRCETTTVM